MAALLLLLLSHPLIHGDGIAYFMYLDSIAGDGDLDLRNQTERFAAATIYHHFPSPVTGEPVTSFPFGSAFLLAPFYWLGQALEPLVPALQAHPAYFYQRQGLSLAFSLTASLGAAVYTLAAVGLAYATARRVAPAGAAAIAAVAALAGTPLLYYATVEPMASHAYGAFLLALALWLGAHPAETAPVRRALALGLVMGMALLVRWQLLLYALPVGVALGWRSLRPRRQGHALGATLAFAAGVGLFGGLCAFYFWRFFGSPFVIPNEAQIDASFVGLPLRHLPQTLFDLRHGWLVWSPLVGPALVGLVWLACTGNPRWRVVALVALAGIGLELALNASLHDWRGGWAFGQRRMSEAYPALALGTAWLLGRGARWGAARLALVVGATAFGLVALLAYLYYTHASPHPEGGSIIVSLAWLLDPANWSHVLAIFAERYGPWAWDRPEL